MKAILVEGDFGLTPEGPDPLQLLARLQEHLDQFDLGWRAGILAAGAESVAEWIAIRRYSYEVIGGTSYSEQSVSAPTIGRLLVDLGASSLEEETRPSAELIAWAEAHPVAL